MSEPTSFSDVPRSRGVYLHGQHSESVLFAIAQLTLALSHLDDADEHVAAALVADALSRLGSDVGPSDLYR